MIPLDDPKSLPNPHNGSSDIAFEPSPGNGLCERLSDKWSVMVLWRLENASHRRLRFSVLKKQLGDITQRMLTLTLRNLEREGLVARDYFPEIPPRVEYTITELGMGALQALLNFNVWVRQNLPTVVENRRVFDENER